MSSTIQAGSTSPTKYVDPTPMPAHVPHVEEVGATSAPLKSAAFFLGAYCKEYNGSSPFRIIVQLLRIVIFYRGFYALQKRKPVPGSLFEGR